MKHRLYRLSDIQNTAERDNYNIHFDFHIMKYFLRSKITHASYTFDNMKDVIQFMSDDTYRYHGYTSREDYVRWAGKV